MSKKFVNLIAFVTIFVVVVIEIKNELLLRLTSSVSQPDGYLEMRLSYYVSKVIDQTLKLTYLICSFN